MIRSANDFSQAYIFIILMPVITSFMVLILTSVKAAVLLLRGQTREMSHSPTSLISSGHSLRTRDPTMPYNAFAQTTQAAPTQNTDGERLL